MSDNRQGMLFSPAMARAIIKGEKSVTRRVVRPQPGRLDDRWPAAHSETTWAHAMISPEAYSPYGKVGQVWYVKERWSTAVEHDHLSPSQIILQAKEGDKLPKIPLWYADGSTVDAAPSDTPGRWRHGMFMPYHFSRATFKVTEIRAERLHQISFADVFNEGIDRGVYQRTIDHAIKTQERTVQSNVSIGLSLYRDLWDSINGNSMPFRENPYVWVVRFEAEVKMLSDQEADEKAARWLQTA